MLPRQGVKHLTGNQRPGDAVSQKLLEPLLLLIHVQGSQANQGDRRRKPNDSILIPL